MRRPALLLAAFFVLFGTCLANVDPGIFLTPQISLITPDDTLLATADLNRDGLPDLITEAADLTSFSVSLNRGHGVLGKQVVHPIPGGGGLIATGDFNGDGNPDLLIATPRLVRVLLGNGDGTFGKELNSPGCNLANLGVAVGDFTGDGILDVALSGYANPPNSALSIMQGRGDGTFQAGNCVVTETGFIVAGDVNGDGKLDIVSGELVLLGNGDGSFGHAILSPIGRSSYVVLADVNNDGILDEVAVDYLQDELKVALGNGDGSFRRASTQATDHLPGIILAGDFNEDGNVDVVVLATNLDSTLFVGNGTGSFRPAASYEFVEAAAAGDFDADGHLDIMFITADVAGIIHGNGNGTFDLPRSFLATTQPNGDSLLLGAADFNQDGIVDLVTSGQGEVDLLLGKGDGTFGVPQPTLGGHSGFFGVIADFNRDGLPDVANYGYPDAEINIFLGNGAGLTYFSTLPLPESADWLEQADMNGDGKADLVILTSAYQESGTLTVWPGNGDGTFGMGHHTPLSHHANNIAIADFNGDGKPDVVIGTSAGVEVLQGNGKFGFRHPLLLPHSLSNSFVRAVDLNGDGHIDIVAVGRDPQSVVAVALGNGDGTFQPSMEVLSYVGGIPVFADFNLDGKVDMALAATHERIALALGNGDGTFQPPQLFYGFACCIFLTEDVNADGAPDLLVSGPAAAVSVLLNMEPEALLPTKRSLHAVLP